jgi:hypothetical protein
VSVIQKIGHIPGNEWKFSTLAPDSVTDWVSVEVCSPAAGLVPAQSFFFLKENGNIADMSGTPPNLGITGITAGNYYIIVGHRNHFLCHFREARFREDVK